MATTTLCSMPKLLGCYTRRELLLVLYCLVIHMLLGRILYIGKTRTRTVYATFQQGPPHQSIQQRQNEYSTSTNIATCC